MAYGKGTRKDAQERRAVEIGRVALRPCAYGPPHPLAAIRTVGLPLTNAYAQAVWPDNPLDPLATGKALDARLLAVQANSGLNSVWAESRRMVAAPALKEQAKRRGRHLFGLLSHARANTPVGVAVVVGSRELDRVATALDAASDRDLFDTARRVGGPVIAALCAAADAAYPRPQWIQPRAEMVVAMDHRSLRAASGANLPSGLAGDRPRYLALLAAMTAALRAGQTWRGRLHLSGPVARGGTVVLPVVLSPPAYRRAGRGVPVGDLAVSALVVSIGPTGAVVRAVLARAKPVAAGQARYVLGRDVGYRNTVALAVVDLGAPQAVDARDAAAQVLDMAPKAAKAAARDYLEQHVAPEGARVVEARVFSGRRFLDHLAALAKSIDGLRSEIDRVYARIGHLKATLCRALGVDVRGRVETQAVLDARGAWEGLDGPTRRAHARLFRLLDGVGRLKAKRLALYARADGVKRSWLGWLSNQEAALASRWAAAVVAEDYTVLATEKGSPEYKGRAFNRMVNAGALGRYGRIAKGKLAWMGVASRTVPSYHTSRTDVRNGVVEANQRQGDVFTARADGLKVQADVHAAATVALWPFLVPKDKATTDASNLWSVCNLHGAAPDTPIVRRPLFVPSVG